MRLFGFLHQAMSMRPIELHQNQNQPTFADHPVLYSIRGVVDVRPSETHGYEYEIEWDGDFENSWQPATNFASFKTVEEFYNRKMDALVEKKVHEIVKVKVPHMKQIANLAALEKADVDYKPPVAKNKRKHNQQSGKETSEKENIKAELYDVLKNTTLAIAECSIRNLHALTTENANLVRKLELADRRIGELEFTDNELQYRVTENANLKNKLKSLNVSGHEILFAMNLN